MKKKLIFISWFLLFSLSLFPLVSCSISETQNLNQKINEQNSVKDIVMNVETKYKISPGGYYGFDALNIVTVTDESKNTNFNNKDKLQQLFFPNGNWKELIKSNESSHIYSDEQALYVIRKLKTDYIALLETLKNEINSRWLDS